MVVLFDLPDTQILVVDTDGTTEIFNSDDAGDDFPEGNEYGSTIRFRAEVAGTYYLVVTGCCSQADHGESGSYELLLGLTIEIAEPTLDTDPANDGTAGADDLGISGGGSVLHVAALEDRAEPPGDVDMYRVLAQRRRHVDRDHRAVRRRFHDSGHPDGRVRRHHLVRDQRRRRRGRAAGRRAGIDRALQGAEHRCLLPGDLRLRRRQRRRARRRPHRDRRLRLGRQRGGHAGKRRRSRPCRRPGSPPSCS